MRRRRIRNQRGSALIACSLVALVLLASVLVFANWVHVATNVTAQSMAKQKALMSADSGVQAALEWLSKPQASQLTAGQTKRLTNLSAGTTFELDLTREVTDPSKVDVLSYGYFPIKSGNSSYNGKPAQRATIQAQIQQRNVGDYFAASPGSLEINYGSDISSGTIYANNLTFDAGTGSPGTVVKAAYYFSSVTPGNSPSFVQFLDPPNAPVQLTSQPTLPQLDAMMANLYQQMAGADVIRDGAVLTGALNPPANQYKVYYSTGTVTLGDPTSNCMVNGSFLIYAAGDIIIANSIERDGNTAAWPALLSMGNVYISPSAPDQLDVNSTIETNGDFVAKGQPRSNGIISVTGGIVAGGKVSLGNVYSLNRIYRYQAPDPGLPLPFTTQTISYKVIQGAYTQ